MPWGLNFLNFNFRSCHLVLREPLGYQVLTLFTFSMLVGSRKVLTVTFFLISTLSIENTSIENKNTSTENKKSSEIIILLGLMFTESPVVTNSTFMY